MYFRKIPFDTFLYRFLVLSSLDRRREPAPPRTAAGWVEFRARQAAEAQQRREAGERASQAFKEAGIGLLQAAAFFGVAYAVQWLGTLV